MLIHSQTLRWNSHRENFQVQYLAKGHFDMQPKLGNPSISRQPSLPPGPQPLHIRKINVKINISSPKTVQIGRRTSCALALVTGGPQGRVLSPHLITPCTHECNPTDGQDSICEVHGRITTTIRVHIRWAIKTTKKRSVLYGLEQRWS